MLVVSADIQRIPAANILKHTPLSRIQQHEQATSNTVSWSAIPFSPQRICIRVKVITVTQDFDQTTIGPKFLIKYNVYNAALLHVYHAHIPGIYLGPCILRSPIDPGKYGLKFKVVLEWRDIYIESIRLGMVLKWRDLLSGGVLNHRDHCIYNVY